MDIQQQTARAAAILSLRGEFTFAARRSFVEAVEKVYSTDCRHLILNLAGVRFVDSAALGVLVVTQHRCNLDHRQFSLVNPQPYVQEIFKLANLDQLIPIYASEEAALATRRTVPARA